MKKLILFSILFGATMQAKATHAVGGEITYEYIGDSTGVANQYQIFLTIYRRNESGSASLGNTFNVDMNGACFPMAQVLVSRFTPANSTMAGDGGVVLQSPSCINSLNPGSGFFNISAHYYKGKTILPSTNCIVTFSWQLCCRSGNIDNIINPAGTSTYLKSVLNPTEGHNSSIQYTEPPRMTSCLNLNSFHAFGGHDKDGDSVFYELVPPLEDGTTAVVFDTMYSATQPITSATGVFLNTQTGFVNFKPTQVETALVGIKAKEFRKDTVTNKYVEVGKTRRELIIIITSNCRKPQTSKSFFQLSPTGLNEASDISCNDSIIKLSFNGAYLVDSLSQDGSEFEVINQRGDTLSIASAEPSNTSAGGFSAHGLWLHFNQPFIYKDTLQLRLKKGSDGNGLITACADPVSDTSFIVVVDSCAGFFSTDEFSDQNHGQTETFPNPVTSSLTIKIPDGSFTKLEIYDLSGRKLTLPVAPISREKLQVDFAGLNSGIYLLRLHLGDSWQTIRIIKNENN